MNRIDVKGIQHYVLLLLFLVSFPATHGQDWARSFGNENGSTEIIGVVSDSENSIYVAGTFSSEKLEPQEGFQLNNNGISDVFLIKYSTAGNIVWAKSFGGSKGEAVNDICIDSEGNIFITGAFQSEEFSFGGNLITSSWPENVYIARISKHGDLQWLKHSSGISTYCMPSSVSVTPSGKLLFAGYTLSMNMTFGSIDITHDEGSYKAYFGEMDRDGNFLQASFLKGEEGDQFRIMDIAGDPQGNIYLGGTRTIHTEPDPVTWSEFRDILYVGRINPEGTSDWTHQDTDFYEARRIEITHDSLLILGNREEFRNILNGGTIDTTSMFYIGMFDTGGNMKWETDFTGALAYDVFSGNGMIMVTGGLLLDQMDFNGFEIERNDDSSSICPIYRDIFYLELDRSGEIRNVKSIPGSLEDIPTGIWLTGSGDLLYTGIYESYSLQLEKSEIINHSELNTFMHVSGTYYDRRPYSFVARDQEYGMPAGTPSPIPGQIIVYPNPGSGLFWLDGLPGDDSYTIMLYDIHGRMVYSQINESFPGELNFTGLGTGIFILKVHGREQNYIARLLIQ